MPKSTATPPTAEDVDLQAALDQVRANLDRVRQDLTAVRAEVRDVDRRVRKVERRRMWQVGRKVAFYAALGGAGYFAYRRLSGMREQLRVLTPFLLGTER